VPEDSSDDEGDINDGDHPHRVLANGTAKRINVPHAQNQVAPALGGELHRRWWGDARAADHPLRRQAALAHTAHFVGVPAVVADHLRPFVRDVLGDSGQKVSGGEDLEIAVDFGIEPGAADACLARVADDAVALADGVVEAGQLLAARGGLDPEAELADLDGLLVQVHAVEVVLENLPVEVEEGALAAKFLQPGLGESDVQAGVAFVNGAKQAAEVVPERVRVGGVAVLEGLLEGFGGQQAVVFAEGPIRPAPRRTCAARRTGGPAGRGYPCRPGPRQTAPCLSGSGPRRHRRTRRPPRGGVRGKR